MFNGTDYCKSKDGLKHDILYSKARNFLNHRHIKRPWFDLNPFLEKADETINLDVYRPGESKFIQPLVSLVLCERYSSDAPLDTREIVIDSFFDYLYSDEWKDGCSLRVLEGQLLSHFLEGLYMMEKRKQAVRHITHAFARNSRPKKLVYKLAEGEGKGSTEETLLLEFTYFGRLTKEKANPNTLNPLGYLRGSQLQVTTHTHENMSQQRSMSTDPKINKRKNPPILSADSLRVDDNYSRLSNRTLSRNMFGDFKTTEQREQLSSVISKAQNVSRFAKILTNRQPLELEKLKPFSSRFRLLKEKSKSRLTDLADFDDYSPFPETDEHDNVDTVKEDTLWGDEFYLTDSKIENVSVKESVKTKLQRKKSELQQKRSDIRRANDEKAEQLKKATISVMPQLVTEKFPIIKLNLPEQLPKYEEYIKWLRKDDNYNTKHPNKVKTRVDKIAHITAKQSQLFRLRHQPSSTRRRSSAKPGSKVIVKLPTLQQEEERRRSKFSQEVLGVTDSEPCRKHCLISINPVSEPLAKTREVIYFSDSSASDEEEKEGFDAKRLNYKYSMDIFRKSRKDRQKKKKPAFYDILTKYYKMQDATTASPEFQSRTAPCIPKRLGIGKFLLAKVTEQKKKKQEPIVVGKLRRFAFNDHNIQKKKTQLNTQSQIYFSQTSLEKFHARLATSLDDFVVRRERVVTDQQTIFNRSVTCVTLTRKSCFQNKLKNG